MSTVAFPVAVTSLAAVRNQEWSSWVALRGKEVEWEPGGSEGPAQSVRAAVCPWGDSTGGR